jgi:acetyltransferase-like isoleucine patch superfamily enzyme
VTTVEPRTRTFDALDFTALPGSDAQKFLARMGVDSWPEYLRLAIVTGLSQRRRGATGIALRRLLWPLVLGSAEAPIVLEDVVIRGPSRIYLGNGVAIEHHVVLDAKSSSKHAIRIGSRAVLRAGVFVDTGYEGYVHIGERAAVGPYCQLWGGGGIVLGQDALLSKNVSIVSTSHGIEPIDAPIKRQRSTGKLTTVGANCFLGVNAVVMEGVTVGAGTVVGANSVVTKDLPAGVVAAGAPARVLRDRKMS